MVGAAAIVLSLAVTQAATPPPGDRQPFVVVLGIAQDGGAPQAGCRRACCADRWREPDLRRGVACLGIVDPESSQRWLIDATPDFPDQLRALDEAAGGDDAPALSGILLTHGHIGHYTGLVHLGREVMGARGVTVHAMPRLGEFLSENGPWDQLVGLGNIRIEPMKAGSAIDLNERISVTPFLVPHRDEYTETVGFSIDGPARRVIYIPDIDKWDQWERRVEDLVAEADAAYLDGTFFSGDELPGRNMAEIPHPFIVESMERFGALPTWDRAKIRFIHLNHTNPALRDDSAERREIRNAGFAVAVEGEKFGL